ncbi:hypothetical protein HDF25_002284 [Pedobacter cryoconitis]|uniref:Uncharacterized protein n=1 Tax=Pedobacter cryoconitis TaxID=188932 RepID=A0A7X0J300_9SPHI|nr:hypothetical protein [Pedobacter cryoconitis]
MPEILSKKASYNINACIFIAVDHVKKKNNL